MASTSAFDSALAPFGAEKVERPSFFKRFMDALVESRMKAAERELSRHQALLSELKPETIKIQDLPF